MPESTKAPDAFRTISEVAEELDLPQHVLRFWETRFNQIKPMKRGGGRRYYRPEDVELLRGIRVLLYSEGFTIRGVQRLLKEKSVAYVASVGQAGSVQGGPSADRDGARDKPQEAQPAAPAEADAEPDDDTTAASDDGPQLDMRTDPGLAPAADTEPEAGDDFGAAPAQASQSPRPEPARAPAGFAISDSDRRRIELALADLMEAKRLLDQVR